MLKKMNKMAMFSEPLISVVVPVFNSEKYIKSCVSSILEQSYKNIEIILINDGSTDRSEEIIINLKLSDSRIRTFNQKNSGVSVARNNGVKNAKGKYICFVDSDDYLPIDAILNLYKASLHCSADIVIGDFCLLQDKRQLKFICSDVEKKISPNDKISLIKSCIDPHFGGVFYPFANLGVPWAKIYKKDFLLSHHLKFDERLSNMEDMIFNLYSIKLANKIIYTPFTVYSYRLTSSSLVTRSDKNYRIKSDIIISEIIKFAHLNNLAKDLQLVLEYKKLCLIFESIKKWAIHSDNNDNFNSKILSINEILDDKVLRVNSYFSIRKYMSVVQKICSILVIFKLSRTLFFFMFLINILKKNLRLTLTSFLR